MASECCQPRDSQALTARIAYTLSAYHISMHAMAIKLAGVTI